MKPRILRELKCSFLLFLWLALGQYVISTLLTLVAMLVLALGAFGVIPLVGRTPLWEWITGGVLICLFWFAMGWLTPRVVRPGPVGTVVVLMVWAMLTSLMHTIYLLFFPQEFCGGMLEQILLFLNCEYWTAKDLGITIACFLLSAVFGTGLYLGQQCTTKADHYGNADDEYETQI